MSSTSSPNDLELFARFKQGDQRAASGLFGRYKEELVRYAKGKLGFRIRRVTDAEDIVQEAFNSFFRGSHRPEKVLAFLKKVIDNKIRALVRDQHRHKRGKGRVRGESAFGAGDSQKSGAGIEQIEGRERDPFLQVQAKEQVDRLRTELTDDERTYLDLWLKGSNNAQIAKEMARSVRTVQRIRAMIQTKSKALEESNVRD